MKDVLFNLTLNSRDIGGYSSEVGTLKHNLVIRSDALKFLTEENKVFLLESNITTQIDLRTESVVRRFPSSLFNDERFNYYNFPLTEGSMKSLEENDSVSSLYSRMVENKEVFYNVFKTFINAKGGVIINCTAGKDRTGMVIYMMLSLCEIDFETILEDYNLSDKYIEYRLPIVRKEIEDFPKFLGDAKKEYLIEFHKRFISKYQSVENYLLNVGLTLEEINKIKTKLMAGG